MTAEAVSKDKLFAHADILDKGDMGWTVIGARSRIRYRYQRGRPKLPANHDV